MLSRVNIIRGLTLLQVCGLLELIISFMPLRYLQKVFPPLVTSITVMLIGVSLTGVGMKYWGGGAVCADMVWKEHSQVTSQDLSFPPPGPMCSAGEVSLGYGSKQLIGLGFSVMVFLVFIELFGSVFMKYVFHRLASTLLGERNLTATIFAGTVM